MKAPFPCWENKVIITRVVSFHFEVRHSAPCFLGENLLGRLRRLPPFIWKSVFFNRGNNKNWRERSWIRRCGVSMTHIVLLCDVSNENRGLRQSILVDWTPTLQLRITSSVMWRGRETSEREFKLWNYFIWMLSNMHSLVPRNIDGGCTAWILQLLRYVFVQVIVQKQSANFHYVCTTMKG